MSYIVPRAWNNKKKLPEAMQLNLGCGSHVVPGWVNVDYAFGARCARIPLFPLINARLRLFRLDWKPGVFIHDLRKRFPWADGTVEAVYCSHMLEHLTREEGRFFLNECHRVLRAEGALRLVVPDLRRYVSDYLEGRMLPEEFVERLGVLHGNARSSVKNRLAPLFQFPHRCMYDAPRLLVILGETGFAASQRKQFESDIPNIRDVEIRERTEGAVIVEGRKRMGVNGGLVL